MTLTPRSLRMADAASLDDELEALHHAAAAARRTRWHGGDLAAPELASFLSSQTKAKLTYGSDLEPGPEWRLRRNCWQEGRTEVR